MSEEMKTKLQERKEAVKTEFEKLNADKKQIVEQGKELQRRLNAIDVRLVELKAIYAEVESMLKPDSPKKKERKKK